MKASLAIVMCDSEYGCGDYFTDYYEQGATNWRELTPEGWRYEPNSGDALCAEHATEGAHHDV